MRTLAIIVAAVLLSGCAYLRGMHDLNNPYPMESK